MTRVRLPREGKHGERKFHDLASRMTGIFRERAPGLKRSSRHNPGVFSECPDVLRRWLEDPGLKALPNQETRGHMKSDLPRYLFAALYGIAFGHSPKAQDFPEELAPRHRNWKTGKFADRFRVQLWDRPATTITSHISKDGHYFIHPDPVQCRSLTVREAARSQASRQRRAA